MTHKKRVSGVARWRTAIGRARLSKPSRLALEFNLYSKKDTILDYGCGRGTDVALLTQAGFTARGWDPYFMPGGDKLPADTVNLGYVLNVIENRQERALALKDAFDLAARRLIVAVRPAREKGRLKEFEPYGDGVMTARNTFQKFFSRAELGDYIRDITGKNAYFLAEGVAVVFKDDEAERDFTHLWAAKHHGKTIKPYRP